MRMSEEGERRKRADAIAERGRGIVRGVGGIIVGDGECVREEFSRAFFLNLFFLVDSLCNGLGMGSSSGLLACKATREAALVDAVGAEEQARGALHGLEDLNVVLDLLAVDDALLLAELALHRQGDGVGKIVRGLDARCDMIS
jgi:hypothetical protein